MGAPTTHDRLDDTPCRLALAALLLATTALTCFTGDDLAQQPCETDVDCNPRADVLGRPLRCVHDVCGYTPRCGDGLVDESEQCDDGNDDDTDACLSGCKLATCGDGKVWRYHEDCEDGNDINTDACVSCEAARCGDGVTHEHVEACDDGNADDTDLCHSDCTIARCGDGLVQAGVEACDDGNAVETDACLSTCRAASCGDGLVQAGVEACDDGNPSDEDPCRVGCVPNVCGDGIIDVTREGCDDQNTEVNDGCANDCTQGATALGSGPGANHFCAIRAGKVRCWGNNYCAQLGYGSTANLGDEANELPALIADVPAEDPGTAVVRVVGGGINTCVLLDDHRMRCWGCNPTGQVGVPPVPNVHYGDDPGELPTPLVKIDDVNDAAAGGGHICALTGGGDVRCWGANNEGQLGIPTTKGGPPDMLGPVDIGVGVKALQISAGQDHTCARLSGGDVRCWGSNLDLQHTKIIGQLGHPNVFNIGIDEAPSTFPTVDLGGKAVQIAAGARHTCALMADGQMRCWGYNTYGQLGNMNTESMAGAVEPPSSQWALVKMLQPGDKVVKMALGLYHSCVLLEGGGIRCWGEPSLLGYDGSTSYGGIPDAMPPLVDLGGPARDLVLNYAAACALLEGGVVRCWGDNAVGQLGINGTHTIGDQPGEMPPQPALLFPNP